MHIFSFLCSHKPYYHVHNTGKGLFTLKNECPNHIQSTASLHIIPFMMIMIWWWCAFELCTLQLFLRKEPHLSVHSSFSFTTKQSTQHTCYGFLKKSTQGRKKYTHMNLFCELSHFFSENYRLSSLHWWYTEKKSVCVQNFLKKE